jgi:hypothetical protein
MIVLAIDPGPVQSAIVGWDGNEIRGAKILNNDDVLKVLDPNRLVEIAAKVQIDVLVIEQIKSYGMAVSDSIFDTVFWTGRFVQAWEPGKWVRVPRMEVKMHLCHQAKAKDANISQALKDRFEPGLLPKQRPKGILKDLRKDLWAAFALAVYYFDKNGG